MMKSFIIKRIMVWMKGIIVIKRYMLFCGEYYYPCGGMNDFKGYFDSVDDALNSEECNSGQLNEWHHIYDTELQEKVVCSEERIGEEYSD